jgi:hypothetical protein
MNKPVGGRGYTAPYTTTHVRVPVDIKPQVELLVQEYRDKVLGVSENKVLTTSDVKSLTTLDDVVLLAQDILSRKQSARKSLSSLLSALYGVQVKL